MVLKLIDSIPKKSVPDIESLKTNVNQVSKFSKCYFGGFCSKFQNMQSSKRYVIFKKQLKTLFCK